MLAKSLTIILFISFLTPIIDAVDGKMDVLIVLMEENNESKDAEEKSENTKETEEDKLVSNLIIGQKSVLVNNKLSYIYLNSLAQDPHLPTFSPPPDK